MANSIASSKVELASSASISVLGVIISTAFISLNSNTFTMNSCSCFSSVPSSAPMLTIAFTSSSLTSLICSPTKAVRAFSKIQTIGKAMYSKANSG